MSKKFLNAITTITVILILMGLAACQSATAEPAAQTSAEQPQEERVFKIWHYETGNAIGDSWASALEEFKAMHPDVTVEFEEKSFQQIQETARMVLNSNNVPDVMEINKGNATAGLYAKEGLLTDLSDVAAERGWNDILNSSLQTTSRYDDNGIMGSGPLYGATTYGEFVMVYYNKDMFKEYGVEVPTTLEEFEAVADTFVEAGIVPLALGGGDRWPATHNWQELVLYKADRDLINNFQLLQGDVDFHGSAFTFGSEKLVEHVQKGYYRADATGISNEDANAAFVQGQHPMVLTGSWQYGAFLDQITDFEWGIFIMPGKTLNTGSGGNLLVVPQNAANKDLAYDFIDLALGENAQTVMANAGGVPVNADLSKIENKDVLALNEAFNTILANDGLAFYPDWPVPGYMDTLGGGLQQLIGGTMTPAEFLDSIAAPYNDYKTSALP